MKLVKFEARWCGQCKQQDEVFKSLLQDYPDLEIQHIDVETEDTPYIDEYNIQSLPTTILFKDDGSTMKFIGLTPKKEFEKHIITSDFTKGPLFDVS